MTSILEYSIKHHVRARHIKIKVNGLGQVEVVAPQGVSVADIDGFVQQNTTWIYKTLGKLKDERLTHPDLGFAPPKNIIFPAISTNYTIHYFVLTGKPRVQEDNTALAVYASSENEQVTLLRGWLQKKAKQNLVPWLHEVSLLHKIKFNKVAVRGQKTRWGSCSNRKNINLNRNLLFLTPELVKYLMVHELSHIIQPNHSVRFWSQVALLESNYRALDTELSQSHLKVPLWAYTSR